jgi:Tfp pilus assembly protein PilW
MATRTLRIHGSSLIELTVGLCVASIVAAMATVALSAAGIATKRHLITSRDEDRAWLALAAIARDLETAAEWHMCTEARDCPNKAMAHEYSVPALVAGDVAWLLSGELRRCGKQCESYTDGVSSFLVVADVPAGEGLVDRQPFQQRHGADVNALEVVVTMRDGRRFSRVVSRRKTKS